jgi:hypothetical protein
MSYHRGIIISILLITLGCLSSPLFAEDVIPPPTTDTPAPTPSTPTTTATDSDNIPQGANRFSASGKGVERELGSATDVDFYKLTLRDAGNITLELNQKNPRTNSLVGWRADLYSENDLAHSLTTVLMPETMLSSKNQQGLSSGNYYIKVSSLHPEVPVLTTYNIRALFEKSDNFEKAPNQTPATATPVQFNQRYLGNLSYASEVDYYRFNLTADDTVTINLNQDNPGINSALGWALTLFSAQSLDAPLQAVNMTETMSSAGLPPNLPLPTGEYFLRVHSLNPQAVSANSYQLTVNAASQGDANRVCAQVIAYGQNPVTLRWVAFPTPCDVPAGWFSQIAAPTGVDLQATSTMKRPYFAAETSLLDIPAVEIPDATGKIEVYQAQLRLISTQPTFQFELVPSSLATVK